GQLEPLGEPTQRRLDLRGGERLDALQLFARRSDDGPVPVEQGGIGLDLTEEETGEVRELAEPLDLLLHDRRRTAHELLVPVVALLPEEVDELVAVSIRRKSP